MPFDPIWLMEDLSFALSKQDFGVRLAVDRTTMWLPSEIAAFARDHKLTDVETLMFVLDRFPNSIATALGWSVDEARVAIARVHEMLRADIPGVHRDGKQKN